MINSYFLSAIGNTKLIKLRKASDETRCNILGKAEFLNPGGSVKDRAAKAIVLDAVKSGHLKQGGVIVEGTAGNTGIGYRSLKYATTGYNNNALGLRSLDAVTTGWANTGIGADAGGAINTGQDNTCLGAYSGSAMTTSVFNVCVGVSTGDTITTGSYNTILGNRADPGGSTNNDEVVSRNKFTMSFFLDTTMSLILSFMGTKTCLIIFS